MNAASGRPGRLRAIPPTYRGMRVGLLGGSFDPAHAGHAHIAKAALKRLGLHRVWWLPTPQNPLKARSGPFAERLASAAALAKGPRMLASDLETRLALRFTADTLRLLRARRPGVRFVWIMGEDSLAGLHRWRRWPEIFAHTPILALARPGAGAKARSAKALNRFAAARRLQPSAAAKPPAWTTLPLRHHPASSTALRGRRSGGALAADQLFTSTRRRTPG